MPSLRVTRSAGSQMFREREKSGGDRGGRNLISWSQPRVMPSLVPATGMAGEDPFHDFLSLFISRISNKGTVSTGLMEPVTTRDCVLNIFPC